MGLLHVGIGTGGFGTRFDTYQNVEPFFNGITHVHTKFPLFSAECPHSQRLCVRDESGKNTKNFGKVIYGISEFTYCIMPYTSAGREGTTSKRTLVYSQEESYNISNIN